jgi:hypothetical protein
MEVFQAIDDDGSDSLTMDEFCAGLARLGFYKAPNIPARIASIELMGRNLFPYIDQDGHGCVSGQEFLCLEKDKRKREILKHRLTQVEKHGGVALTVPLPKQAEGFVASRAAGAPTSPVARST